jgi:hypothetical protein
MEKTYNYIFWHNHHEGLWFAIPKESYLAFFGGKRDTLTDILSNKDITELINLVIAE